MLHTKIYFTILLTLNLMITEIHNKVEWCSIQCKGAHSHTVCNIGPYCYFSGCEVASDTGVIDKKYKDEILDVHNSLRTRFAEGVPGKGVNPHEKAADMHSLSWDENLEYVSACYGRQCIFEHDICRNTPEFPWNPSEQKYGVGQNLFYMYSSLNDPISVSELTHKAVIGWYEEITYMQPHMYENYNPKIQRGKGVVKHFTQLIWAKTTHIGCSWTKQDIKGENNEKVGTRYFVGCNYGNAGNQVGEPVYTKGEPCSQCPEDEDCDYKYTGLCGLVQYAKSRTLADGIGGTNELHSMSVTCYVCLILIFLLLLN